MKIAVALALLVGCSARPVVTSCADSLAGAWRVDDTDRTWALLDGPGGVEGYPTFADPVVPRALSLARSGAVLAGSVTRRFDRDARACTTKAAAHVLSCADDTLDLIVGEPPEPVFAADDRCVSPVAATHRERWHRVR